MTSIEAHLDFNKLARIFLPDSNLTHFSSVIQLLSCQYSLILLECMNAAFSYLHLPSRGPCALFISSSGLSFYDESCFSYLLNFRAGWGYPTDTFVSARTIVSSHSHLSFLCLIILHIKVNSGCTSPHKPWQALPRCQRIFLWWFPAVTSECFKNQEMSLLPRVMWAPCSLT